MARHLRSPGVSDNYSSWGSATKFFHWLVAALILAQFVLGWLAARWRLSPTKLDLFVWHKSTGMLILALLLIRVLCRLASSAPVLPVDTPAWERVAAAASHAMLYVFMVLMPITGWIINSAAGIPFRVYWSLPLPSIAEPDKHVASIAGQWHLLLGVAFGLLLVVHIGAALRHHFVKQDNVLIRMLPSRSSSK